MGRGLEFPAAICRHIMTYENRDCCYKSRDLRGTFILKVGSSILLHYFSFIPVFCVEIRNQKSF